ncbi:MAG TPA: hypothetical protein VIS95_01995 [Solirubrobacterales bacterium]
MGEPEKQGNGPGPSPAEANPFTGAAAASPRAKWFALVTLGGGLVYCLLVAGLAGVSRNAPFQTKADFALFAGFIVVAGAIERIIQPLTAILPPFKEADNVRSKADRTLLGYGIALIIGVAVSSVFGLYFMEAIGVSGEEETLRRGLDIFLTALIITGGTKSLHETITSIEKKKENLKKAAGDAV